jgi:hypothetical protein
VDASDRARPAGVRPLRQAVGLAGCHHGRYSD